MTPSIAVVSSPHVALVRTWQRARLQVRCGLSVERPAWIKVYLRAGLQLVQRGLQPAVGAQLRMLQTLLLTAEDEALPVGWRAACLDHVHLPMAQLTLAWRDGDPIALRAAESAVQRARNGLPHAAPVRRFPR